MPVSLPKKQKRRGPKQPQNAFPKSPCLKHYEYFHKTKELQTLDRTQIGFSIGWQERKFITNIKNSEIIPYILYK